MPGRTETKNRNVAPALLLEPVEVRQTVADHFLAGIVTPAGGHVAHRLQQYSEEYFAAGQA